MNTKEYTEETGFFKKYDLEKELETLVKLEDSKPSKRIIKTRKGRRALAILKDIEINNNHSWYRELKKRSRKSLDSLAIFYRGNKISYREMFEKADSVACSLKQYGISKGDEIPVCISNIPELIYLLLGANKIGAKVNLFGSNMNKEYIKQILDGCTDKLLIASDDLYGDIEDIVNNCNFKNKLLVSLADSLPKKPEETDEYEPQLDKYYRYENRVSSFKEKDSSIISFNDFLSEGDNYLYPIEDYNDLDTEFLITYTSGSTKIGYPKALVHANKSLIVMGRFHDPDACGNPKVKNMRALAHIHPESNTDVITCISDSLMQNWAVAMEPEYDKDNALDLNILNKPTMGLYTTSFLIKMAKQYLVDKKYYDRKLEWLLIAMAVGEGVSKGEEKFINMFLRKAKAGSGVNLGGGLKLPFTTLSIGGGDCEHGGIYYTLWKTMQEKLNFVRLKNKSYGMMPVPFAHVSVFKPIDANLYEECNYNEYGIIAANSITTMNCYKNNKEATSNLIIRDNINREWISSNVYGYIDEIGGVHVKGRIDNNVVLCNGNVIPSFMIEDVVCEDTKNILSCTVTASNGIPIINIEFQPFKKESDRKALVSVKERCRNKFGDEFADNFLFRVFDFDRSFELIGSGKRSVLSLENMGFNDTFMIDNNKNISFDENIFEKIKENSDKKYIKK